MKGRRVVVVGGTSGMGLATVRAAAAQGAEASPRAPAGRRPRAGGGRRPGDVDVTDAASVRALFDGGPLDHLFVPPRRVTPGAFLEQEPGGADLPGRQALRRLAVRPLRRAAMPADGSITFVTGVAAVRPPRHAAMVTAAFAGVEALSRALALELGPLRVNTIRPGYTDSEMWGGLPPVRATDLRARVAAAMPVGRIGTPEDIAHAALFLMTKPQTTGAVVEVSGGEIASWRRRMILVTGASGHRRRGGRRGARRRGRAGPRRRARPRASVALPAGSRSCRATSSCPSR